MSETPNRRKWTLEEIENQETGEIELTLCRFHQGTLEEMGTVSEYIRLFKACQNRWSEHGWDIDKLIAAVNECPFD